MWIKATTELLTRGAIVRSAVPQEYGLDDLDHGMKVLPAHALGMVMEMDDRYVSVDFDDAIIDWAGGRYFDYRIADGELDALEIWRDWIEATPELLVEGAKVRSRPLDDGESGRILAGAEGVVTGYARGNIYIDFDIEHGALVLFNVKRREYETLEVWVKEESL